MNVLLTGSGGFIGGHLKEYLKRDYTLFAPRSFELNLRDRESLGKYLDINEIEFIIHSAAAGVRISPDAKMEDVAAPNLEMFFNLAAFVNENRKMITFGSGAEYGKSRPLRRVSENDFGNYVPKDPYGYSKYIISKEIEKRKNILNLRIFGIYGAGEDPSRVTTSIIKDNLAKQPITLNQNVVYDFIYIADFCKIVAFFIKNFPDEKFINLTPDDSIEIVELAKIVNAISGYESQILLKNEGLNKEYTGSNSLLRKIMGDIYFTSYKEGMEVLYGCLSRMPDSKNNIWNNQDGKRNKT